MKNHLLIDIGNTSINFASYKKGVPIKVLKSIETLNELPNFEETFDSVLASSVVPSVNEELNKSIKQDLGLEVKYVGLDDFKEIDWGTHYNNPNEIGADILSGAYFCYKTFPKQNLIIADSGTATTICALNKDAEFLGGIILPGLELQLNSLCKNTSLLNAQKLVRSTSFIGRTTEEAINIGIISGRVGAVSTLIEHILINFSQHSETKIILSGGAADVLKHFIPNSIYIPNIVLAGLALIV